MGGDNVVGGSTSYRRLKSQQYGSAITSLPVSSGPIVTTPVVNVVHHTVHHFSTDTAQNAPSCPASTVKSTGSSSVRQTTCAKSVPHKVSGTAYTYHAVAEQHVATHDVVSTHEVAEQHVATHDVVTTHEVPEHHITTSTYNTVHQVAEQHVATHDVVTTHSIPEHHVATSTYNTVHEVPEQHMATSTYN